MSVSCNACLCYGWMVESDDLTSRYHELYDEDFVSLDERHAKLLGGWSAYELATPIDVYRDNSPVFIGKPIPTMREVRDENGWLLRMENVGLDEFAKSVLDMKELDGLLAAFYEDLMGVPPEVAPTVQLFEEWS